MSVLNIINNRTFYRFYPSDSHPFRISYEPKNKYGFGIYFLDNATYYSNQHENANLCAILPNVKNPKVYEESATIPNTNYIKDYLNYVKEHKGKANMPIAIGRNDFNEHLKKQGHDSIVIHEHRGMYLVLLEECPCLYTLLNDEKYAVGGLVHRRLAVGGTIAPLPFVSASKKEAINDLLKFKYKDLSDMEANILYNNFKEEGKIIGKHDLSDWIYNMLEKIHDKDYLEYDSSDSSGFSRYGISVKGQQFIDAVNYRYQTRYNVKKGTDLFPELANIPEYEEEFKEIKEKLTTLNQQLSTKKGLPPFFTEYEKLTKFDDKWNYGKQAMSEADFDALIQFFQANPDKFKSDYAFIIWQLDKQNNYPEGITTFYEVGENNKFHEIGDDQDLNFKSFDEIVKYFYEIT